MNFDLTDDQQAIQRAVADLAAKFDDDYWAEHDHSHEFPWEFYNAFADAGWIGIAVPEEYGGAGLGILEASLMMQEIAASGGAQSAASAIHMSIFGMHPVVKHGSDELRPRRCPGSSPATCTCASASPSPTPAPTRRASRRSPGETRTTDQWPQGLDLEGARGREDPAADSHHPVCRTPRRPTA